MSLPNYYAILGVPRGAAEEEIKRAYRNLTRRHHPDRPGGNQNLTTIINRAYEVLGKPGRRVEYDARLKHELQVMAAGQVIPPSLGDTLRTVAQLIWNGMIVTASDPRFWEALAQALKDSQNARRPISTQRYTVAPLRRRGRYRIEPRRRL